MDFNKRNKMISGSLAGAMLVSSFGSIPALAENMNIDVSEDAMVYLEGEGTSDNYGSDDYIILSSESNSIDENGTRITYLKFRIDDIDVNSISDITLKLKLQGGSDDNGVVVREAGSDWSEDTVNGENKPELGDVISENSVNNGEEIIVSNLKAAIIKALEDGKTDITFAVLLKGEGSVSIASKESGDAPVLTLIEDIAGDDNNVYDIIRDDFMQVENAFTLFAMSGSDTDETEANAVITLIEALKSVNITAENYTEYFDQINELRKAYDELSYYAKAIVGNANLQVLTSAESSYERLEKADIDAVNNAVDDLEELTADNYLENSRTYVDAKKLYDDFVAKQNVLASGSDSAVARHDSAMAEISAATDKLNSMNGDINGFMDADKAAFKSAVQTNLDFNITEKGLGEDLAEAYAPYDVPGNIYITRFVSEDDYKKFLDIEDYIENAEGMYNKIKESPLYDEFISDDDFKDNAVQYLKNYYKYKADQLKVMYGDTDSLGENIKDAERWDPETNTLYTYIAEQREKADNALDAAKEFVGADNEDALTAELSDYIAYHAALFEAMNITIADAIDELVEAILPLAGETVDTNINYNERYIADLDEDDLKDLNFTMDDIAIVAAAKNAHSGFNQSIMEYLHQYDNSRYLILFDVDAEGLPEPHALISAALDEMENLANAEMAKYQGLVDKINDYALNYKSGFESQLGGAVDSQDPDEFIVEIESQLGNIKEAELIEYYTSIERMSEDAAEAYINTANGGVGTAIQNFKTKLSDIKDLRSVSKTATDAYDAFEEYFGYDYMMNQASSYNNFAKHEDVVEFVDDFIESYNTINGASITLDDVMGKFDAAVEAKTAYVTVAAGYSTTYPSDNYEAPEELNRQQPYMSETELNEIENLAAILYKHIDMTDYRERVSDLYDTVFDLVNRKEDLYTAQNGFADVAEAKAACDALRAEYDAFTDEQKYCIPRDAEEKLSSTQTELDAWDTAIDIMDAIDAIDDADEIDEFTSLIEDAQDKYGAADGTRAEELVADAASDKLNFYKEFIALYNDIMDVPVIVSEHQIKDYESVISNLRTRFDELVVGDYANVSAFVGNAKRTLEDREFEMACAKEARRVDMLINDLDTYADKFVNSSDPEDLRAYVDYYRDVVEDAVSDLENADDVDGRPQSMAFGMLLQYSKFTHHREDIDNLCVEGFVMFVDNVGVIDYTSDFDEKQELIDKADKFYDEILVQRQYDDARTVAAKTKLENLKATLARCRKARDDAQEAIGRIAEFNSLLDELYSIVYKPDSEVKLDEEVVPEMDAVDSLIKSLSEADNEMKYAYEYMVANGYIDSYDADVAELMDRFSYYSVQKSINELWAEAQESKHNDELLDITYLKEVEDQYNALKFYEYFYDTGRNQQELVENYSKLAWVREKVNENEDAYIDQLEEYMDETGLMDADAEALSISYKPYIENANNIYSAMSPVMQSNVDTAHSEKLLALIDALKELDELYAVRGGKAGDIDEDGKVTIKDVVMIVDFALDNDIDPENTAQYLRADIVYPEKGNDDEDKIDINDVIAAIDLIEF
ncbi:MAG: DNRLRE domain-containing protein [Clostridia bacterium]|nr:DNRLRE domain-containing protein [Clostridia bacterium]